MIIKIIIIHSTNIYKSKLKIYQLDNKTHKNKRQCNCFALIFFLFPGGSSTDFNGRDAINGSLVDNLQ